jgi:hypothetical protein
MKKLLAVGLAIATLTLAACHNTTESLGGTYGIVDNGKVEPVFKVESHGGQYSAAEYQNGKWVPISEPVKPFGQHDLEALTDHKVTVPVDGIQTNSFVLFHVPKGWSLDRFTASTGYIT